MVLYSGLWKANNRYDQDRPRREGTNRPLSSPGSMIGGQPRVGQGSVPDPVSGKKEMVHFENTIVDGDNDEGDSKSRGKTTSNRRRSKPTYMTSVLFGGLWARGNERRQRHNQSDDGTSLSSSDVPQQYGAVASFADIENDDDERNGEGKDTAQQSEEDDHVDDDDELDFPSLTTVFRPDDIDWTVLRMCLFYLAAYIIVAIVAYCFVFEHWTIIDALYFAVSTFTTVGYGDLQPTTTMGQLFTIVFAIYGVIVLGIFIGIFGHAISESQAQTVRKLKAGRQRKLIRLLFRSTKKLEAAREIRREGILQEHASLLEDVVYVIKAEMPSILVVVLLACILGAREGWSLTSTAYFAIMSASTTGDYTPKTQIDKLYCVFFLPISVAVFGEVLGRIASVYITRRTRQAEQNFLRRNMTKFDLRQMDTDDDGQVSMDEWLCFMLVSLQKVDPNFMEDLKSIFYDLDVNGNGYVDKDDLVQIHKSPQWRQIQSYTKED